MIINNGCTLDVIGSLNAKFISSSLKVNLYVCAFSQSKSGKYVE